MKLSHARRSERRGFTLVELMIVIAIISVLISLISAAVWKALVAANRAKVRSEIAQFAVAVENFKAQYKFYPPSRLHLAAKLSAYNLGYNASGQPNNPLDADSVQILLQMFPGIKDTWSGAGINWAGTNPPDMSVNTILEGDQCLVFFLGGIPDNFSTSPNCTGFSTNAFNPAAHIPLGGNTSPSFFEFDSSRLLRASVPGRDGRFYSYKDTYGQRPYAYFSSGKSRDNYNRYVSQASVVSDCRSLGVWPYAEVISTNALSPVVPQPRYLNPNSFQIISAGADGVFGAGTFIRSAISGIPRSGLADYPNKALTTDDPGYDDLSNFRESTLGSGS